jgi:hypothetical protein
MFWVTLFGDLKSMASAISLYVGHIPFDTRYSRM